MAERDSCEKLTSSNHDWKGWLVATGNIVISDRVIVNEHVRLILADGCKVTGEKGIEVETAITQDDAHLTIYAQSSGDRKGQLITTGDGIHVLQTGRIGKT